MLPLNTREVPSWKNPVMGLLCPFDNSPSVGTSSSNLAPTELEEGLLKIFERIGVSIPTPVENYASASHSLDPFCMFSLGKSSIHPHIVKVPRDAA